MKNPLTRLSARVAKTTAYDRIIFHGKLLDRATVDALKRAEVILGYELTVVQGIGGAAASAGTHTEGRAVDLAPYDHERKVRVLRTIGFAAWYRPALAGVWGAHVHAVLVLNSLDNAKGIAGSAFRQIGSYVRGRDGLKGDGPDPDQWRPSPISVFRWPQPIPLQSKPPKTNVTRARDRLAEAHAAADQAAALLATAGKDRPNAYAELDDVRQVAERLERILDRLPKK